MHCNHSISISYPVISITYVKLVLFFHYSEIMTSSMNILGSKKLQIVPLTYKYFFLSSALSTDSITIPGYVYEETCKITFQSHTECGEMLDFLLLSLEQGSAKEKLKALKVLKYLVTNGDEAFRQDFRKRDRLIKEATGFSGSADPIHGNSLNTAIRSEAEETLRLLFEDNSDSGTPSIKSRTFGGFHATGMGSQSQQGKYEGFGNAPVTTNKTMVDKVMDVMDKIDNIIYAPDKTAKALTKVLKLDRGSYQSVALPAGQLPATDVVERLAPKAVAKTTSILRSHVPGRAGGGWDDEDDASPGGKRPQTSIPSTDSLESEQKREPDVPVEENLAEEAFVNELLDLKVQITSWFELDKMTARCATLNCEKIMELLVQHLQRDKEAVKLNVMLLIEALYCQYVLPPDILYAMCKNDLKDLALDQSPKVQAKSRKLMIMFEKVLVFLETAT